MRKILNLVLMTILMIVITGCTDDVTSNTDTDVDTMYPIIQGLSNDTIYESDIDSYDFLEGITAIDNVDGDVTSSIEISGNLELSLGKNIVTYYVSDSSGNSYEVKRLINVERDIIVEEVKEEEIPESEATVDEDVDEDDTTTEESATSNLLHNGDMTSDSSWVGWFGDEWAGYTSSTMTIENGELAVDVILNDTTVSYATQVYQEGIKLINGNTYLIKFDAYSEVERSIIVQLGDALDYDPWFTQYIDTQTFELVTEYQTFEIEFTMANESTEDQGKLVFELGSIDGTSIDTKVYIDNVSIELISEGEATEENISEDIETDKTDWILGENLITNGTFDSELENGWDSWMGNEGDGGVSMSWVSIRDNEMEIDVVLNGAWAAHATQIFQDGIALEEGVTYAIEFDARANDPRPMNVNLGDGLTEAPWWVAFKDNDRVDLTTEWQHFRIDFTMNNSSTPDQGKLVFELGAMYDTAIDTFVYIDNVSIKPLLDPNESEN